MTALASLPMRGEPRPRRLHLRRLRDPACLVFGFLVLCRGAGQAVAGPSLSGRRCLENAQAEISRVPNKGEKIVTTSRAFKVDLARFFCRRGAARLAALELGIFHGHTTVVLSTIFGQVFALDVEPQFLQVAAKRCATRQNVFFLTFDSYSDPWWILAATKVDVAIIDGDHAYEKVQSDAWNVLRSLSPARWLAFDDFGTEDGVRQTVNDLLESGALQQCWPIGKGRDGSAWPLHDGKKFVKLVSRPEGMLCSRGNASTGMTRTDFVSTSFFLYAVPADDLVRAAGVVRFSTDGGVWTSHWGKGLWQQQQEIKGTAASRQTEGDWMRISLQGLQNEASGSWELLWNRGRSAFLLTPEGGEYSRWFGMQAEKATQPIRIANEHF